MTTLKIIYNFLFFSFFYMDGLKDKKPKRPVLVRSVLSSLIFYTINNNVQSELARCLEDNDFRGFTDALESAREIDYDLDQNYGKEVGYKTILHLALGEDTM